VTTGRTSRKSAFALLLACSALFAVGVTTLRAQDFAVRSLEDSPRHHEWVEVPSEGRTVHSFVAHPETDEPTPAVVVIHENRGLTDWVRSFADRLAGEGYLAIAPDLLSEFDPEHERTVDFATSDAARAAIYELDPEQVTSDLHAVRDYAAELPSTTGAVAVMGFCWGGSTTFRFATRSSDISAALVFYGTAPDDLEALRSISAPVHGFYAENDERVNATIPETESRMERFGKSYDVEVYEGVGHAFMRAGADPGASAPARAANDAAFRRVLQILAELR
jgi:carboxymethylenebutenolidase